MHFQMMMTTAGSQLATTPLMKEIATVLEVATMTEIETEIGTATETAIVSGAEVGMNAVGMKKSETVVITEVGTETKTMRMYTLATNTLQVAIITIHGQNYMRIMRRKLTRLIPIVLIPKILMASNLLLAFVSVLICFAYRGMGVFSC